MGALIKYIAAIALSVLIVTGTGAFGIYVHTCQTENKTTFWMDDESIACEHEKLSCCEMQSAHSGSTCFTNSSETKNPAECCQTTKILLQLDNFTQSIKSDKKIEIKSIELLPKQHLYQLNALFEQDFQTQTDFKDPDEQSIPLILQRQMLKQILSKKHSVEPLIA